VNSPAKSKTHIVPYYLWLPAAIPTSAKSLPKQLFLCPLDETPSSMISYITTSSPVF
jgi:hypothetical protein